MGGTNRNKKGIKRPPPPKPGDPDYKTPTQLRNARKRRKLQRDRTQVHKSNSDQNLTTLSVEEQVQTQKHSSVKSSRPKDPSQQFIHNPKAAPVVQSAKRFFENIIRTQNNDPSYSFPIYVGPKKGWRTVARLAVRRPASSDDGGSVKIGLFVPGSHELLEVPDCPAHHPRINDAVRVLQEACNAVSVQAFDETTGEGHLRYVAISIERSTGKQQVTLVWNEQSGADNERGKTQLKKLVWQLTKTNDTTSLLDLHSLWVHYNNTWKHANSIVDRGGRWEQVFGKDSEGRVEEFLWDAMRNDVRVPLFFPPQVFRQANLDAFAKIVLKIRQWLKNHPNDESKERFRLGHCLELYGGVGTIGLNMLDMFRSLESSDENPFNKACFEASVARAVVNGEILKASRQKKIVYQSKSATDMIRGPKGKQSLHKADVIIVDPPRKGLDAEVIEALNTVSARESSTPQVLVYVSCGFDAFRENYKAFVESGSWKLEHAEGHILFPGSDAIETLAFFTK
jgi:tRNA/tmRNA/rRNA uracil-C5-methylase (TrmA/RlmC/RlmD family)